MRKFQQASFCVPSLEFIKSFIDIVYLSEMALSFSFIGSADQNLETWFYPKLCRDLCLGYVFKFHSSYPGFECTFMLVFFLIIPLRYPRDVAQFAFPAQDNVLLPTIFYQELPIKNEGMECPSFIENNIDILFCKISAQFL